MADSLEVPLSSDNIPHGAADLPSLRVESYSLDLREEDGFVGDKASETAFRELLDEWRERLSGRGVKPFGEEPTEELERGELDEALRGPVRHPNEAAEAETLERTLAEFSRDLTDVLIRFLQTPSWRGTQRIVCGGGLQSAEIGQEVLRRAQAHLREADWNIALTPLSHEPDDGGMIGWAYAAPSELLAQGNGFLAVDIGGTNLRCGLVSLPSGVGAPDVVAREKWCHADETPSRDEMVEHIAVLLRDMAGEAERHGLRLSPVIGLACPGLIRPDGAITSGVQNLPGDWSEDGFFLPERIRRAVPLLAGRPSVVLLHNDAVIQGLSEAPSMRDVSRWAAVTIGTGLGNVAFRNHAAFER